MSLFSVKIVLTELGVEQYERVIAIVFGFISLLNEESSLRIYYDEMAEVYKRQVQEQ